jgi:acetyl esterase/lipase
MRRLVFIFSIILLLASCNRESLTPDPVINQVPEVAYPDVTYGTDPLQKMDIFLPAARTVNSTKTMVVIHGGAWMDGDKADMTFVVDSMKKRLLTYAIINVNYRLAANGITNVFPSQETDVKTAVEFYLNKSTEYKVSKDIIVLGASAGAHLALLHSYKNDPDKHVKAVVDFFGPTDLALIWNQGFYQQLALTAVTGKTYSQDPAIYTQSGPINFVTAQSPPTIVLQGGIDDIVLPVQSTNLIDKLNLMGVPNQLVVYPNEGHGFTTADNVDALGKILPFISKYVK